MPPLDRTGAGPPTPVLLAGTDGHRGYVSRMLFDAHVLRVLIASPGDTQDERDAVERALHDWNATRAAREQVVLLPRRWETNAVPVLGGSGQGAINKQLLETADIVIALFDSRLGQATEDAVSGTAEEIQRADAAGKQVHVYSSEEPLPREVDAAQLTALREFKEVLRSRGLLGSYADPGDLAGQVRNAIEHDLEELNLGAVQGRTPQRPPVQERAVLRAEYLFDREQTQDMKGRLKMKTVRTRLRITNHGSARAESVRLEVAPLGDGEPPQVHDRGVEPDIAPLAFYEWPLFMSMGTSQSYRLTMTWKQGEDEYVETQDM